MISKLDLTSLVVLRVWDVILFEGNRTMLFRTTLALLDLYGICYPFLPLFINIEKMLRFVLFGLSDLF